MVVVLVSLNVRCFDVGCCSSECMGVKSHYQDGVDESLLLLACNFSEIFKGRQISLET